MMPRLQRAVNGDPYSVLDRLYAHVREDGSRDNLAKIFLK